MSDEQAERKLRDLIRNLERKNATFEKHFQQIKIDFLEVERIRDERYAALREAVHNVYQYGEQKHFGELIDALRAIERIESKL